MSRDISPSRRRKRGTKKLVSSTFTTRLLLLLPLEGDPQVVVKTNKSINQHLADFIIIGPAFPLRGGIANFNEALCRELNHAGDTCSILSFTLQYPGFLFPGTTQYAEKDTPPGNIRIQNVVNSINPVSWFRTVQIIIRQKPRVVIIRYWLPFMALCLGTIARMIRRSGEGIRVIAIADNVIPHEKRPGDTLLTRYFVKSCDAFIVMSQNVMDDLRKFDRKVPSALLPHPVYDIFGEPLAKADARKELGIGSDEKIILFFGFIRKYKGLDLLLKAMAEPELKDFPVKLVVAGEFYEEKEPYVQLIQSLGISNRILLHDFYIPKEKVRFYFCASDLVVQPYRDATQSGVTQIAYHFSKPMLVTKVGGLSEIVPHGEAGYVTDPEPGAIATAIADFFNHNRGVKMEEGVKAAAEKFSWPHFVTGLKKLVDTIPNR